MCAFLATALLLFTMLSYQFMTSMLPQIHVNGEEERVSRGGGGHFSGGGVETTVTHQMLQVEPHGIVLASILPTTIVRLACCTLPT